MYFNGRTLLHYAAMKNYPDMVRRLLELGLDVNKQDNSFFLLILETLHFIVVAGAIQSK